MGRPILIQNLRQVKRSWDHLAYFYATRFHSTNCKQVRVRFAPSPTGHLHLGGFRTALINYLYARKYNGKFLLRIEDTDQARAVEGTADLIENDLEWLHIPPDESPKRGGGHGPYTQSERLHHYHKYTEQLIASGHAYRCFCTDKRLDLLRKHAIRQRTKFMYDGKCRELSNDKIASKISAGEVFCVRFKLPPPPHYFEDIIQGPVTINELEGDFVILKSDKFPTYHLACVVDDHLMDITHVLRGIEWSVSTGKHLSLFNALGITPPKFAHLPLLRNSEGGKLSKRQGDISIDHYRKSNYYPYALINFALGIKEPMYSMEEILENFDLSSMSPNDRKLDFRELEDLNQLHLKHTRDSGKYRENNLFILKSVFPDECDDYYERLLNWCPDRVAKLQDIGSLYPFLSTKHWSMPEYITSDNVKQELNLDEHQALVSVLRSMEKRNQSTTPSKSLEDGPTSKDFKDIAAENGLELKLLMLILRRALCGCEEGPPIREIIFLLSWKETKMRLQQRAEILASQSSQKLNRSS